MQAGLGSGQRLLPSVCIAAWLVHKHQLRSRPGLKVLGAGGVKYRCLPPSLSPVALSPGPLHPLPCLDRSPCEEAQPNPAQHPHHLPPHLALVSSTHCPLKLIPKARLLHMLVSPSPLCLAPGGSTMGALLVFCTKIRGEGRGWAGLGWGL